MVSIGDIDNVYARRAALILFLPLVTMALFVYVAVVVLGYTIVTFKDELKEHWAETWEAVCEVWQERKEQDEYEV